MLAQSLEDAVKDAIVMITGASSGIGKSASIELGKAGGTVLLVARSEDKLVEVRRQIELVGGTAYVHMCDLSDIDDIDRMASEVLERARAGGHPRQQRRQVDPAFGRPGLRPLPRLPAHDAAQLLRPGQADPRSAAGDARARDGAHRQRLDDRPADEHPAVLRLSGLQGGARRVLALDRARDHRRRRARHDRLHAARAHADDRPHEDLRILPHARPRRGRRT